MSVCPHCSKSFTSVSIGEVSASVPFGTRTWRAVSYNCPHHGCGKSLGVEIDPIALKHDVVREVISKLRG